MQRMERYFWVLLVVIAGFGLWVYLFKSGLWIYVLAVWAFMLLSALATFIIDEDSRLHHYAFHLPTLLMLYVVPVFGLPIAFFAGVHWELGWRALLLIVVITTIAILLGSLAGWIIHILRDSDRLTISQLYARKVSRNGSIGTAIFVCASIAALYENDLVAACIVAVLIIAVRGFDMLTTFRAERGWFGENEFELLELLEFIVAKTKSGGFPPISRGPPPRSEAIRNEASAAQTAEVRA